MLLLNVKITEDKAVRGLCFVVWCRLPGLHPWGLAGVFVVGPGLFPAKLRRSSACA